jgi:polyhydroxyalkanoate synthase
MKATAELQVIPIGSGVSVRREITRVVELLHPDHWLKAAEKKEGSWWPAWHDWLVQRSAKEKAPPPPVGKSLGSAPDAYVFQK